MTILPPSLVVSARSRAPSPVRSTALTALLSSGSLTTAGPSRSITPSSGTSLVSPVAFTTTVALMQVSPQDDQLFPGGGPQSRSVARPQRQHLLTANGT